MPEEALPKPPEEGAEAPDKNQARPHRLVRRASVKSYVDNLHPFAITFQDLSVYVPREKGFCSDGEGVSKCACLTQPLASLMSETFGYAVQKTDPYYALNDTSGFVKTGQMVLVLSPDTQFSSALIQTLTGRLSDKYSICGAVRVNGKAIPTDNLQGWRRIAAHVSADDGTHAPVLTVRETLRFAAECTRSEKATSVEIEDVVNEVLEILDLSHVADTVVGDENLRGISGGQKRRVTVGEMLIANGTRFLGLENISDGLSSQDSFNIVTQIKCACESFQTAAVISLNQPSDEIVALFENVLVLDHRGEMAYFGPPSDRETLRYIFLGSNSADGEDNLDVGSIADLCLNRMEDDEVVDAIRERFNASASHEAMQKDLVALNNRKAKELADVEELLPKTKYASGMRHNFKIVGKRKFLLISRNPSTYLRLGVAIFFGVVVGSLFSVLTQDIPSSLARTAFIFQNLFLVLLLSTGVTVPQNIRERVTYFKHRSAEFYSSKVNYLCQIMYELPLSILEALLLGLTTYWWVGMNPLGERVVFYLAVLIAMEFCGLALGRLFCAISRTQVIAKSVVSVITLLFSTVSGFMPKYQQIPPIFRWLSWLSPPAYGFEALAINEYVGRNLTGIPVSIGGGLDTQESVVPGESWLNTLQIPRVLWADNLTIIKIFDLFMLIVLAVVFDLLGMTLMERSRRNFFSQLRRNQRTTKSLSFALDAETGDAPDPPVWPTSLTVSDLCYLVPLKPEASPERCSAASIFGPLLLGKKKGKYEVAKTKEVSELQLLDNVSATFKAGKATALMGTSGAGKTTLLDVIAGYKTGGRITGDLTLSGLPKDRKMWQLLSGYAEQSDILNPYLTVLETLKFTASCRLPGSMNRMAVINKMIGLMKLEYWVDIVVGVEIEGEGIPKHVRKRLTIAVQLVMLPKILFLDEPTTGLGTSAANLVMTAIRRSTTELNLITVATIHQPSKLIWDSFDDLILLTRGGKVAYMGEMGHNSQQVTDYFAGLSGSPISAKANPADYVISSVSAVTPEKSQAVFKKSQEHKDLMVKLEEERDMPEKEKEAAIEMMKKTKIEVAQRRSFFRELGILTKRMLMIQWRNPAYSVTRMVCSLLLSMYFGILFGGDKSMIEGAVLTIGATFFLVFVLVVPMQAAVVPLIADRAVLYREATAGLYSRWSYAIASLLADIPFHIVNCLLMFVGFYFLVGFQVSGDCPLYFIIMIFFVNWAFTSIGEVFAVATPNEEAANGFAGLTTILSVLFMGFLINVDAMPDYWKWANHADLLRYVIQGLTSNELGGNRYFLFPPPEPEDETGGGGGGSSNSTFFGDLGGNTTNIFLVPGGTDTSPGSDAAQASTILNLLLTASPSLNQGWNSSILGTLDTFVECGMTNDCFVEPVASNFMGCFVFSIFDDPVCVSEFNALTSAFVNGSGNVATCLASGAADAATNAVTDAVTDVASNAVSSIFDRGNNSTTLESRDDFDGLTTEQQADIVVCLLNATLPGGTLDEIQQVVTKAIGAASGITVVAESIFNIIEYGLPGEVILFVFGWAEFQEGELVAPFKWWYCLFAVSMFVVGLEVCKIFATRFFVWTKR